MSRVAAPEPIRAPHRAEGHEGEQGGADYFAVHPGDVEELQEATTSSGTCTRTKSAAPSTAPASASSPF